MGHQNRWAVQKLCPVTNRWRAVLESVGTKSYANGYYNALQSVYPRPAIQLVDADQHVYSQLPAREKPCSE